MSAYLTPQVRAEFKKKMKLQFPTVMADKICDLVDGALDALEQELADLETRIQALETPG